jgi:hypothetical protein
MESSSLLGLCYWFPVLPVDVSDVKQYKFVAIYLRPGLLGALLQLLSPEMLVSAYCAQLHLEPWVKQRHYYW